MSLTTREPLISIGVPVYNGERFIRRALDSLLAQTYENIEVVICDNASTDNTEAICREYAIKDPRIHYYRNPTNIGVTANHRRVFELSSGEYFMWACVDDVRPPTAAQDCLEALLPNDRAVMAYGPILLRVEEGEDLIEVANEMHMSDLDVGARIRTFTQSLTLQGIIYGLYKRDALAQGVFPACYGQEYLFCLQMCLLGSLEYVKTPMVIYRLRRPLIPPYNPMYAEVPITPTNLLQQGGLRRWKCWVVLLMGCYYLLRIRSVSVGQRGSAITAHVSNFSQRYRTRLAKEIVFQLFWPVSWLASLAWNVALQWSVPGRLARKLRTRLTQV